MPSKQADTSKLDDQLAGHDFCQRLCLVKLPNNDNNPDERPSSGRRPRTWGKVESHKLWPAIKFNSQGELLAQIKKTVEKKHAMALCRWSATEIARERRTSNLTAKETMEFGVAYLLGPRSRFRPAFVWLTGNYNGKESEQVFDFYTHYFEMEDALGEHCGSRELQAAFKLAARRMVESSNVEVSTQPRQKTRESKSKKKGAIEKGKSRSAINEAVPVKMVVFSAANGSGSVSSPESPPFAGADEWHSEAARESTTVETTNVNNSVSKHSNRLESQFKYSAQTDSQRHTEMASRVKKGNGAVQAQAFKAVEAKPVLKATKSHAKNAAEVNNKKSRKRPFGELVQSVNALDRTKRQAILDKAEENEKSMSLINEAPPVKMVVFSAENGSGSVSSPEKPSFTDDEVLHSEASRAMKRRRAVQAQAAMAVEMNPVPEAKKRQAKNDAKVNYNRPFQGPVSKAMERVESQAMLTSQQSDEKASKAKKSDKAEKKKSAKVSQSGSHNQRNTAVSTSSAEFNADIAPSVPAAQGSLVTSLSGGKQKSAGTTIIKEEHSSNKTSSHIDWDEETNFDQHFGTENCNAGKSYSNSGRTEVVWKTIVAYGFRRTPNNKFKGSVPHPCFEHFVRDQVKKDSNILANGEIVSDCISNLASKIRVMIRASHIIDCLGDDGKESIINMDDDVLVKEALSTGGINGTDLYYSFCQRGLAQASQSWHCRICKCCKDSRNWHCKGCNRCRQGIISVACPKCNPGEYLS